MTFPSGDQLADTFKSIALPAAAGAVGTGALTAYVTSKNNDPRETPQMRRKRILRNALMGTAVGAGVGATVPTGLKTVAQPIFGGSKKAPLFDRALDETADAAISNAAPIGVGAVGGTMIARSQTKNRENAVSQIFRDLDKHQVPGGLGEFVPNNPAQLRSLLLTPEGRNKVITMLAHRHQKGSPNIDTAGAVPRPKSPGHNLFTARELMQESGHKAPTLADMGKNFGRSSETSLFEGGQEAVLPAYRQFLASHGPVSRIMSRFSTSEVAPGLRNLRRFKFLSALGKTGLGAKAINSVEGFNPSVIAETYGNIVRPGASKFLGGRMGIAPKLGLLGAGMLGANYLQKKVTGQS